MGEIADMMINGSMCQYCGECFDDEPGYPRSCESCGEKEEPEQVVERLECPACGKHVKGERALCQHIAAKH